MEGDGVDVVSAARAYVSGMVAHVDGMKALILDDDTKQAVSAAVSLSEMFERQVYLVESLGTRNDSDLTHLKGIIFVRPTPINIMTLAQELKAPQYKDYFLFFSNSVPQSTLQMLADADEHELIRMVSSVDPL